MKPEQMKISIHTALAGCDDGDGPERDGQRISIHTALAGCDLDADGEELTGSKFQSTQPSQAVTKLLFAI